MKTSKGFTTPVCSFCGQPIPWKKVTTREVGTGIIRYYHPRCFNGDDVCTTKKK